MAPYTWRAMHRSKVDIGGADARAGGMSISSESGAPGMGVSSSSSDASATVHGVFGSGLRLDLKWASLWAHKRRQPVVHNWFSSQKSTRARQAHSADDCRRHAFFITNASNEPSMTERARVALACVWVQLLRCFAVG